MSNFINRITFYLIRCRIVKQPIVFSKLNRKSPCYGIALRSWKLEHFLSCKSLLLCSTIMISFFLSFSQLYGQSDYIYDESRLPYNNPYYEQEDTLIGSGDTKVMEKIAEGPIRKLGRGLSNVLFGICEVFIQPYKVNKKEGGIAAVTYGLFKGIFYFVGRGVVGVVEIITFPAPLPGASTSKYSWSIWGYGPLIEPEWIFTIEDNPYNIVYPNYPAN
jgi:putative exosortase-associated protein (TIGR04073 family)